MTKTLKTSAIITLVILMSGTLGLVLSIPDAFADNGVTLCHLPPGNPRNAQTIHVGAPAVQAHLAHGDSLGTCD